MDNPRLVVYLAALVAFLMLHLSHTDATPVAACPKSLRDSYFVADNANRCIFYWCVNGQFLMNQRAFSCAPGSGTLPGYHGSGNPCTEHVSSCGSSTGSSRPDQPNGGNGGSPPSGGKQGPGNTHKSSLDNGKKSGPRSPHSPRSGMSYPQNQGSGMSYPQNQGFGNRQYSGSRAGYPRNRGSNPRQNQGSGMSYPQNPGSGNRQHPGSRVGYPRNGGSGQPQNSGSGIRYPHNPGSDKRQNPGQNSGTRVRYPQNPGSGKQGSGYQQKSGYGSQGKSKAYHGKKQGPESMGKINQLFPNYPYFKTTHNNFQQYHFYYHLYLPEIEPSTVYVLRDFHVRGGIKVDGFDDVIQCLRACAGDSTCQGIDYDTRDESCWFHTDQTICTVPVDKPECIHFKFILCPQGISSGNTTTRAPETTASVTEMMTTATDVTSGQPTQPTMAPPQPVTFIGQHLPGGFFQANITDPSQCIQGCILDDTCAGVDFDGSSASCWFHGPLTECGSLQQKPSCVHFRLTNCGTINTGIAYADTHAVDGSLLGNVTDLQECFNACVDPCRAIDFDSRDHSCWLHPADSCDELQPKQFCVHVRKQDCPPCKSLELGVFLPSVKRIHAYWPTV